MTVTTKSPCRVDLAGGTLDIWPLYLHHAGAVTVNFAVNLHTHCTLRTAPGSAITLRSRDMKLEETFGSLDELKAAPRYRHSLAAWVVKHFEPKTGLVVETDSESPNGAGISGSSSMLISTVSAFNRLLGAGYGLEKVREVAQNIEAQIIQVPTGCQDYYPALYGGVSAIELKVDGIARSKIGVAAAELNSRFVLAYTGKPRNSGINNWEVTKLHVAGDKRVRRNFDQISGIAQGMRRALETADWTEAGRLLREEWAHRRKNAPGITTELIDRLERSVRRKGALGAKVCGAGGGGCVVVLCEPDAKLRVAEAVKAEGVEVLDVTVAERGVQVKQAREA